ncbi:MAG: o-succinylbenzoate---CoA ligase [Solirubrobacteraceae bacterium]|nr:o-succinylbenzoate---CoA ligase [Solirubrobacteraceae bacterium]
MASPGTVPAWLPRAAGATPARGALVTPGETLTYADLLARADAGARRLAALGAGPGDRVAVLLPPGVAFAETLHACWRLGAVAVPVDVRLGEAERAAQAAGALAVDAPLAGPESPVPLRDEHDLSAVAAIVHTSGSSGEPKAVALTFGNWLWSALGSAVALGLDPAERWLSALPLSHVGGLSILVRSAIYGTTAVVHERFEADRVTAALGDATLVSLVPTMLARVLEAGWPATPGGGSSRRPGGAGALPGGAASGRRPGGPLRCALIGGGPVPPDLMARAAEAGIPLAQTYGLTEACSQVTTSEIGDPTTAGPPLFCTRVEIAADGEILVRGPTIAPAAGHRLRTGDLGTLDAQGRLTVVGRKADTIVTGGENVAPAEVEAVLEAHPAVAEAAVTGRPDPEWGEAVVALVVLRDGMNLDAQELRAHCRAHLAGFKVPKAIELASELPRTPSGKLRRNTLA